MSSRNIGNVDVQYILFAFTPKKKTLQSDRRVQQDPQLDLNINEVSEELILRFYNLHEERLRESPKLHIDIYILVQEAKSLVKLLDSVKRNIIGATDLDRQIRTIRNPEFTYDDSRVPLRINKTSGNFKVSSMTAKFSRNNNSATWTRDKQTDQDPYVHVDLEMGDRLHLGIGSAPDDIISGSNSINEFEIRVPWSEFGQLYYSIKDALGDF